VSGRAGWLVVCDDERRRDGAGNSLLSSTSEPTRRVHASWEIARLGDIDKARRTSDMRTGAQVRMLSCAGALVLALAAAEGAGAVPLITNGGFEAGFVGWTRADAVGSDGTFFLQSGTASPLNADPVPAPPGGTTAAMTDAQGPGSHVLYQNFVVPASLGSAVLTFDLFIGNRAGAFFTPSPASLDFSTPLLNQQARVDILRVGTGPFSVSSSDVLLPLFQTNPGDPLISGYTAHSTDLTTLLTANAGQTLQLRFAETDNLFTFQLGVDNVNLDIQTVPEPSTWVLLSTGLVGLIGYGWQRQRGRGARVGSTCAPLR